MTINDLLFNLTSRGYVKASDMRPPDENGHCQCHRPFPGNPFWRIRAQWQELIDGLDYLSIYPCEEIDPQGYVFIFVTFNPNNGVIQEWRIGEHWTGDDFLISGCKSFDMALFTLQNWLTQIAQDAN
jgi:hypothetical protein